MYASCWFLLLAIHSGLIAVIFCWQRREGLFLECESFMEFGSKYGIESGCGY